MANEHQVSVASAVLDELTRRLRDMTKKGGFDNKSVIWLAKAWIKVGMALRGPTFHRQAAGYYIMKREPAAIAGKRSLALLTAMEAFERMLNQLKTTEGDFFNRADNSMRDFVWEYRKQLGLKPDRGQSEKEFVGMLTSLQNMSSDQLNREMATGMERHA